MAHSMDIKTVMKRRRVFVAAATLAGAVASGALAYALTPGTTNPVVISGVAFGIVLLAVVIAWRAVVLETLVSPSPGQPGFREGAEKAYMTVLLAGPVSLSCLAFVATFSLARMREEISGWLMFAHLCSLASFVLMWGVFALFLFGHGRKKSIAQASEDELTADHRARGVNAGFVAAGLGGIALFGAARFWPDHLYLATPSMLALPLIVAMLRFGWLERLAALGEAA